MLELDELYGTLACILVMALVQRLSSAQPIMQRCLAGLKIRACAGKFSVQDTATSQIRRSHARSS